MSETAALPPEIRPLVKTRLEEALEVYHASEVLVHVPVEPPAVLLIHENCSWKPVIPDAPEPMTLLERAFVVELTELVVQENKPPTDVAET